MPSDLVSLMQNVQQPAALRMAAWLAWSCCNLDYFVAYYHSNLKQACSGLVAYSALDDLKWAWEVVQGQVMKKAGADMGSQVGKDPFSQCHPHGSSDVPRVSLLLKWSRMPGS